MNKRYEKLVDTLINEGWQKIQIKDKTEFVVKHPDKPIAFFTALNKFAQPAANIISKNYAKQEYYASPIRKFVFGPSFEINEELKLILFNKQTIAVSYAIA